MALPKLITLGALSLKVFVAQADLLRRMGLPP
jgi:hypothetical protein